MKTSLLLYAALFFLAPLVNAQYNNQNLRLETQPATVQQLSFQNLRLYPVKANDLFRQVHQSVGDYCNLEKALEQKKINITELDDELVNTLYVENVSADSVFIMAGEVVKGGKQDRVLAQDVILTPGEKIDISAFCVEQHRWSYGDTSTFSGYYNVLSNEIREVVVNDKDQRKVWSKVDDVTEKNEAENATGTITALEESINYQASMQPYLDKFGNAFNGQTEVIGVVAITGTKVIGCDLFATHELFMNAYKGLLNAYATEAITTGTPVAINDEHVKVYMNKFLADESTQQKEVEKNGIIYHHNGKKMHIAVFDL